MSIHLQSVEYNTESIGGTFDRIISVDPTAFYGKNNFNNLHIDAQALEYAVISSLRRFENDLVAKLSEKAVNRLLMPGRWLRMGVAELICEVVTDLSIRKGSLSEIGRHDRACQIANKIEQHGEVEFAILLLPFRTASPLKNCGTLPDMGEFFTLVSLHAISRACREAQVKINTLIVKIQERVGELAYGCAERVTPGEGDDLSQYFAQAIQKCAEIACTPKVGAVARKRLRQMEAVRSDVRVRDGGTFLRLLNELAFSSVPLDAWFTFKNLSLIPVRILACQDAGRYPCFASVSPDQIAEYRAVLVDATLAMGLNDEMFRLIDYTEIRVEAERTSGRKGSDHYFQDRSDTLIEAINSLLPSLWIANGRNQLQDELKRIDPKGAVAPLFEPLLFSLEHPEIPILAYQSNIDPDRLYLEIMQNIYQPSLSESLEQLRRTLIRNSLLGAALYCAAYEANTGSKNPGGFDDVAAMFPNALRMSIHQKDDAIGHFSILVSPTANRTPWHGSAYLTAACRPGVVQISIELAGLVELAGARRIIPRGEARGIFARHVNASQPIAHLAPTLTVSTPEDLLDLFANNCLTANG